MFSAIAAAAVFMSCAYGYRPYVDGPGRAEAEQKSHAVKVTKSCFNAERMAMVYSMGSGVLYDGDTVITAYHVTAEDPFRCIAPVFKVIDADGQKYRVKNVRAVPGVDAAYLDLGITAKGVQPIAFAPVMPGDVVCLEARAPKVERSCGFVTKVDGDTFDHDAWTDRGNSGSGIYNEAGHLVGIVSTCRWDNIGQRCIGGGGAVSLWGLEDRLEP